MNKPLGSAEMEGCQIPCLPHISEGPASFGPQPAIYRLKRMLARPWNYHVKKWLKHVFSWINALAARFSKPAASATEEKTNKSLARFKAGERVQVRSEEEIRATLSPFKEVKGCAFLPEMWQYCGTEQQILQPLERFLDERDYQVKKCRGIYLLQGVICRGTPVFGRCDRGCHLFWREEWLEKVETA